MRAVRKKDMREKAPQYLKKRRGRGVYHL